MPRNPGPNRSHLQAPYQHSSTIALTSGVHKISSQPAAMLKSRRTSSNSSYTSVSGFTSPPLSQEPDYTDQSGDEEALASPSASVEPVHMQFVTFSSEVEPAQRRSSFMAEGMMKEHLSCDRLGRDKDGYERFVLRLAESHGFKWNRYLHRVAISDSPREGHHLDYVDIDSDCSSTDEEAHETEVLE